MSYSGRIQKVKPDMEIQKRELSRLIEQTEQIDTTGKAQS